MEQFNGGTWGHGLGRTVVFGEQFSGERSQGTQLGVPILDNNGPQREADFGHVHDHRVVEGRYVGQGKHIKNLGADQKVRSLSFDCPGAVPGVPFYRRQSPVPGPEASIKR